MQNNTKEMRTGSIWKCLIFWWWHNVSTNALGLLWLTLSRNNLCSRREEYYSAESILQMQKEKSQHFSCALFRSSEYRKTACTKRAPALSPIDLSLLVDDAMGFFSRYPAMKPQLSYVDDCRESKKTHLNMWKEVFMSFRLKEVKCLCITFTWA